MRSQAVCFADCGHTLGNWSFLKGANLSGLKLLVERSAEWAVGELAARGLRRKFAIAGFPRWERRLHSYDWLATTFVGLLWNLGERELDCLRAVVEHVDCGVAKVMQSKEAAFVPLLVGVER